MDDKNLREQIARALFDEGWSSAGQHERDRVWEQMTSVRARHLRMADAVMPFVTDALAAVEAERDARPPLVTFGEKSLVRRRAHNAPHERHTRASLYELVADLDAALANAEAERDAARAEGDAMRDKVRGYADSLDEHVIPDPDAREALHAALLDLAAYRKEHPDA